jgi:uncharacterized protein
VAGVLSLEYRKNTHEYVRGDLYVFSGEVKRSLVEAFDASRRWNQVTTFYKTSLFNIFEQRESEEIVLGNTMSGAVLKLTGKSARDLATELQNPGVNFSNSIDEIVLGLLFENNFIVPIDYDEIEVLKVRHERARNGVRAFGLGIGTTLACNFRCSYCYQSHRSVHLTREMQDRIVAFIRNKIPHRKLLKVTWFGGEPLLKFGTIKYLTESLKSVCSETSTQYEASITTNGWFLTKSVAKDLADMSVRSVQITLDGPPDIHDSRRFLTGGKPTFEKIMLNIEQSASLFDTFIIRVNIDAQNRSAIARLFDLLSPLRDQISLAFRAATSSETPDKQESWCIPAREFWDLSEKIHKQAQDFGYNTIRGYALPGTSFCSGYQRNSITIDPYGDLHRCPVLVGRRTRRYGVLSDQGEVRTEGGIQDLWDDWSAFQDDECIRCKALPICLGGCLWYVGTNKKENLRCFARRDMLNGIMHDTAFSSLGGQ